MAESIFRHRVGDRGLASIIETASCGTGSYHVGEDADPRTIHAVRSRNIVINHCVRQLTSEDIVAFDYVVAMDRSNFQNIARLAGHVDRNKIIMMRDFDPEHKGEDVPDPYYGNQRHFEQVYEILDRAIDHFIDHLVDRHKLT